MAEPAIKQRPGANVAELTVSELAGQIKHTLEDRFGYVRLRGEITGYRGPVASGHCYFGLKDEKARIDAVIWRGTFQRLRFKPEEGLEVVATGKVTTYPGSSKYQIVIEAMEPAGVGALMALLEERKRKLAAEGLFDEARKRRLPFLPRVVGIVTSPTGAVIRDMLAGFAERFPTRVIVWPVRVQGESSAGEVAAAIRGFNALEPGGRIPRPDVLIVARGGGSLEDLWSFNEEIVVRAAAASAIPLIAAVGHETDWTLIDLAADARAPTPTKAAEWAVPKHSELTEALGKLTLRLSLGMMKLIEQRRTELKAASRGLPRPQDLVALPRQRFDAIQLRLASALHKNTSTHAMMLARIASRLDPRLLRVGVQRASDRLSQSARGLDAALARNAGQRRAVLERVAGRLSPIGVRTQVARGRERLSMLGARAERALQGRIGIERRRLAAAAQLLQSLSYQSVLGRGFALVRDRDGAPVRSVIGLAAGQHLDIEFADGRVGAVVEAPTGPAGPAGLAGLGPGQPRTAQALAAGAPSTERAAGPPASRSGRGGDGSQGSLF